MLSGFQGQEKAQGECVCVLLSTPMLALMNSEMVIEFVHGYEGIPHQITVSEVDCLVSGLIAGVDSGFLFGESNANFGRRYSKFVARELNCCLSLAIDDHDGDSLFVVRCQVH